MKPIQGKHSRLAFVGGGVMAEAMIKGILSKKVTVAEAVTVGEPLEARREHLRKRYGVRSCSINHDALAGAQMVILAVKPQNLSHALAELKGLAPEVTLLSIVAGARLATLKEGADHSAVIRAMPNTPAQVGVGMSVWTATAEVGKELLALTRSILQALGKEIYVTDERYLDMATALSGSGPAYAFLVAEALVDAGVYLGMPREMAQALILQTLLGSAVLAQKSEMSLAELRGMVTSPGGATAEALKRMEEGNLRATLIDAVVKAYQKSKALGG